MAKYYNRVVAFKKLPFRLNRLRDFCFSCSVLTTLVCLINVLGRISALGGHTAHWFSILSVENEFSPQSAENEFSALSAENEFSTLVCLISVTGRLLGTREHGSDTSRSGFRGCKESKTGFEPETGHPVSGLVF